MSYEKIERHQKFIAEKGQALKESEFDSIRSLNRNIRLMRLNNAVSEILIKLNNQTITYLFASTVQKNEEEEDMIIDITVRLKESAEVIDKVLTDEGPFIIKSSTGKESWAEEVSRERLLEFHLEVVMHEIMNIVEESEDEEINSVNGKLEKALEALEEVADTLTVALGEKDPTILAAAALTQLVSRIDSIKET